MTKEPAGAAADDSRELELREAQAALAAGRETDGLELLQALTTREPTNPLLWHRIATLALQMQLPADAAAAAAVAVCLAPDSLEYRLVLADALFRSADLARAISEYEIAAQIAPGNVRVATGLASALRRVGLDDEAAAVCQAVLDAHPGDAAARGAVEAALSARVPEPSEEFHSLGRSLFEEASRLESAAQRAQALEMFRRCAQLLPAVAPAHYRIGCLLQDLGQADHARSHYELAARLQPGLFAAAHNAGKLAAGFGLVDCARRHLTQAHRLRPQDGISMRLELLTEAIHPSTAAITAARERFAQGLDRVLEKPPRMEDPLNKADLPTFYLAYHGLCNRHLHVKLARAFTLSAPDLNWQAPHCRATRRRPGRIRVGFISHFLRSHSIGKVARGLIAELSRKEFEVYVLNIPPVAVDDTARWIQARCDHWMILADALPAAREQIAALALDILFYQDIGMEPYSYLLALARLAPVQCVSYGHPDTTGIPNMDYYVSNDLYEPPGAAGHYSERLFELHALPTLAYYFRPPVPQPTRADLGLAARTRLYVCPQSLFKLHPDFDALLSRILQRDGAGRVLLFAGECAEWSVMLQRRFRRSMPDVAGRIDFLPRQPYARFLEVLSAADVVLDTPHFNGMITSLDAFSVGTPIITLPGSLQRGRVTQAMYRAMGIEDGIAASADQYADLAADIAMDPARRRAFHELILERNHRLFEDRRAVVEFERFFLAAHQESIGRAS
ncbi:MAG: tetratricopeptide repeat protein [Steroidobacteraceae bacterium]